MSAFYHPWFLELSAKVWCCCETMWGNQCCGLVDSCGPFIAGCLCK
jgi:hypothetical protein